MTVIVAAVTQTDGVVMAADRLITSGWEKRHHSVPKIWITDQFAIGSAGCLRAGQVVKHYAAWPKYRPDEDTDVERFLVKSVVPAIFDGAQGQGVVKEESGIRSLGTSLLLATGDHLAEVSGNGSVVVETSGRMAIGSGYAEALGYLGAVGPWTEDDVVEAVRRAIRTARGCAGPISVVDTRSMQIRTLDDS